MTKNIFMQMYTSAILFATLKYDLSMWTSTIYINYYCMETDFMHIFMWNVLFVSYINTLNMNCFVYSVKHNYVSFAVQML